MGAGGYPPDSAYPGAPAGLPRGCRTARSATTSSITVLVGASEQLPAQRLEAPALALEDVAERTDRHLAGSRPSEGVHRSHQECTLDDDGGREPALLATH